VQRLPVRIGLDPGELEAHPLFLGLSTAVEVDVRDRSGSALSKQPAWRATLNTDAYVSQDAGAGAEINAIVAQNLVRGGVMSSTVPAATKLSALSGTKLP
jgi:membrane fusion protein (multidrug efflux system)